MSSPEKFTEAEVAIIRRFFLWLEDGNYGSDDEGITDASDEGILFTEYNAAMDYDYCTLERSQTVLPWIALTDPDEYARQCAEIQAEKTRASAAQAEAYRLSREAQERATFEALKAKYAKEPTP